MGVRLFPRNTRKALTAEGAASEVSARRLLDDIDAASSDLHALAAHKRGRVSIPILPSLAADWLPGVL